MEPDFMGWATKPNIQCSDGRTIMPDAFAHQDSVRVPLVWQHGHADPENVLGHAILFRKDGGVYTHAFFNDTPKAQHAKQLVIHGDINMMSIWANQLREQAKQVFHGVIREVSLVLSGANPGALIEHVTIRHSADDMEELEDEAIIYTGLELELKHADGNSGSGSGGGSSEATVEDVYNSMNEEQKKVLHFMVGEALASAKGESSLEQSALDDDDDDELELEHGESIQDVYDSMDDPQKQVLHYMVGEALASVETPAVEHSDLDEDGNPKGKELMHNVFESGATGSTPKKTVLSHDAMRSIMDLAESTGSLKRAVETYAKDHLEHGINDIETLFPDAVNLDQTPQFLARRQEWVNVVLSKVRKSPFARIKTVFADITMDEARAKGYIKGDLKEEEFFSVSKRTTDPVTIYKRQELDRDDVIDITDFDVIVWLKAEMRAMLDEELARAILIGDGRNFASKDKINEGNIRPIAKDHELFVTSVYVNLGDANSSIQELIDRLVENRRYYKGTGTPDLFVSESIISKFLLLRDTVGRRIYKSLQEVADELRVANIIPVEIFEEEPEVLAVMVNLADYNVGTNAGGQVSMFDDFDLKYNKMEYLIETRCSGALTRLKSAIVVRRTADNSVLATPVEPTFNAETGALTIPTVTGEVYKNEAGTTINAAGSPYTVAAGESYIVNAVPATGYHFANSEDDSWLFTADA